MSFFRFHTDHTAPDAKAIRDDLLRFIRQQLSALQGGEAGAFRALQLWLAPSPEQRGAYEAAVFFAAPGRLQQEVQRIADDFSIGLPGNWNLELNFCAALPEAAVPVPGHPAGLRLSSGRMPAQAPQTALIRVLVGEAERDQYLLQPDAAPVFIGRDKEVRLGNGFLRVNDISFPGDSSNDANRYVSRQHAQVRYDAGLGRFLLFADEGGLPPRNKVKVRGQDGGEPFKLQSADVPHLLCDGDQIILGHSALLEFRFTKQSESNG